MQSKRGHLDELVPLLLRNTAVDAQNVQWTRLPRFATAALASNWHTDALSLDDPLPTPPHSQHTLVTTATDPAYHAPPWPYSEHIEREDALREDAGPLVELGGHANDGHAHLCLGTACSQACNTHTHATQMVDHTPTVQRHSPWPYTTQYVPGM